MAVEGVCIEFSFPAARQTKSIQTFPVSALGLSRRRKRRIKLLRIFPSCLHLLLTKMFFRTLPDRGVQIVPIGAKPTGARPQFFGRGPPETTNSTAILPFCWRSFQRLMARKLIFRSGKNAFCLLSHRATITGSFVPWRPRGRSRSSISLVPSPSISTNANSLSIFAVAS